MCRCYSISGTELVVESGCCESCNKVTDGQAQMWGWEEGPERVV